ncbi:MAG: hypothetical protein ACXQTD_02285 [Candidatus Syntropharchaeia archaeon]
MIRDIGATTASIHDSQIDLSERDELKNRRINKKRSQIERIFAEDGDQGGDPVSAAFIIHEGIWFKL